MSRLGHARAIPGELRAAGWTDFFLPAAAAVIVIIIVEYGTQPVVGVISARPLPSPPSISVPARPAASSFLLLRAGVPEAADAARQRPLLGVVVVAVFGRIGVLPSRVFVLGPVRVSAG